MRPDQDSLAAEALISKLIGPAPVPSLFWPEARGVLVTAERRDRIAPRPGKLRPPWRGRAGFQSRTPGPAPVMPCSRLP